MTYAKYNCLIRDIVNVAGEGFEPDPVTSYHVHHLGHQPNLCGVASGGVDAQNTATDTDLATVIERWPTLSEEVRQGIVTMVSAA